MDLTLWKKRIRDVFTPEQAEVLEEFAKVLDEVVKVRDFNELKNIVKELAISQKELAEAQKKTEERLEELAEAQKRTEKRVEELAEAQKRTEERLEELAEAQKKTEKRLEELAEAQKKTEERLDQLAEAQKRTEQELRELIGEHKKTRQELGGLSHTVGYILEDRAYKGLPRILEQRYNIKLKEDLKRKFFTYKGDRKIEINIVGKGIKDNEEIMIIGESKSQLQKRQVDQFLEKRFIYDKLFSEKKFYLMVTYMTDEDTQKYAEDKGVKIFYSYEFP